MTQMSSRVIETKTTKVPVASKSKRAKRVTTRAVKSAKKTSRKKPKAKATESTATTLSGRELRQSVRREPLGHLITEESLREAGFTGEVSSQKELLEEYATDESIFAIKPQIVLQPKTKEDVKVAVRVLGKETKKFPSLSLTPRAAGTGLSGGSLTDSVVVDVAEHLNRIKRVGNTAGQVTFTCEPGAMWRDVEAELKKYDSYLPPFPASKDICTIGGSVANNAAGPDSLRYGHVASWVESIEIVLHDGESYDVKPLTYQEYKKLTKQKNALANIAKQVFELIESNETVIKRARPKTAKNSAGYALWDVIDTSVKDFKTGNGTFDLTQVIAGSQGTLGIITAITMRAEPIAKDTKLIAVPVFDLSTAGNVVVEALKFDPINVEIFDALTYDLALQNPSFFRTRLSGVSYYQAMLTMYTTYHVHFNRQLPEFMLLITVDDRSLEKADVSAEDMVRLLRGHGAKQARLVRNPHEREMLWQIRRASYTLSKLKDPNKRPAAFLEDMTVPPEKLVGFFAEIKRLLNKYRITAAVHGHGGNGHFHFYPLLDFTNRTTPALIMKMAEEFFNVAIKHDGNICGEHNDGIIRTPHLSKMFSKAALGLFEHTEAIFDPDDIFNPGKKVHPRFDIKSSIRKQN